MGRTFAALALGLVLIAGRSATASAVEENAITLTVPPEVSAGSEIDISFTGTGEPTDFISIDKPGAADREYGPYIYAKGAQPLKLRVPDVPGEYQVRYHRGTAAYEVAGVAPLTVTDVTAAIQVPSQVEAGAMFTVTFSGPGTKGDFIGVDRAGAPDREYGPYVYVKDGVTATLRAPDAPGTYEVRYHLGQTYRVIASAPLAVGGTAATLDAPASVAAGSELAIAWTGPDHAGDFVSIDTAEAPDRDYGAYAYTKDGATLTIRAPEDPGTYAIRYHTGQTYSVIAQRELRVEPVTATITAPPSVEARTKLEVVWSGPDNPEDYIALARPDAPGRDTESYAYTKRGTPVSLQAPKEPGSYEVRYVTGGKHHVLARATIDVTPGTTPGRLRVLGAANEPTALGAVELILDASGSMLQRLDGRRRIDVAKDALTELVRDALPAGSSFALRVFGHREADSCRTDLEIALAPLDRGAALAKIGAIEAKNLAKTPIADSLAKVAHDLAGVEGEAVVVLVTDGEETCDGDPKTAIESLKAAGFDVRLNVVGFAVDEVWLKEQFESWARLGGGSYFDASDEDALAGAIRASLRVPYEVRRGATVVATGVVGGEPIELAPGAYTVEVLSAPSRRHDAVTIVSDEELTLPTQ